MTTICINGSLKAGDLVLSADNSDYAFLVGKVKYIEKAGTDEHENPGDDIHVDFTDMAYTDKRIDEIEADFTAVYGKPAYWGELALDDVIMASDMLVNITGIAKDALDAVLDSRASATEYLQTAQQTKVYTLPDLISVMEPQSKADLELISVTLQGAELLAAAYESKANAVRGKMEMIQGFWGLEELSVIAAEVHDRAAVVRGLVRHAQEELASGGLENYRFVTDTKELLDELATQLTPYQHYVKEAQSEIDEMLIHEVDKLQTETLYSPLLFCMEYDEVRDSGGYHNKHWRDDLPQYEALDYRFDIEEQIEYENSSLDAYRGMMEYYRYHDDNSDVDGKVFSLVPRVEKVGDKLYMAAELKLTAPLTDDETAQLKEWWHGQLSDGYGEGLEQHEIEINGVGKLYIVPWSSDDDFFIATSAEFDERMNPPREPEVPLTLMEQLTVKLDAEMKEYTDDLLTKSKAEIMGTSVQSAAMLEAYHALTEEHSWSDAEITALLDASAPLRDVADALRDDANESMMMLESDAILTAAHAKAEQPQSTGTQNVSVADAIKNFDSASNAPKADSGQRQNKNER
jgi:hypothetical protein